MTLLVLLTVLLLNDGLAAVAAFPADVPNVFGAAAQGSPGGFFSGVTGQLFAFSGLDGATQSTKNFVGVWGSGPENETGPGYDSGYDSGYNLRIGAGPPPEGWLRIQPAAPAREVLVATHDVLVAAHADNTTVQLAWQAWDLLVGCAPNTARVFLHNSTDLPTRGCSLSPGGHAVLCRAVQRVSGLGLAYAAEKDGVPAATARAAAAAAEAAEAAAGGSVSRLLAERLYWVDTMPRVSGGASRQRLLNKAVSVMRVNSLAPEGDIAQHWSTPDRLPHKYMWLWDSCYHSMARSVLNDTLGWEFVKSMLSVQLADGFIPIQRSPVMGQADDGDGVVHNNGLGHNGDNGGRHTRKSEDQTQPPLLTWAVMENHRLGKLAGVTPAAALRERLVYAAPRLAKYLQWDMAHRGDPTGATQLLWWIKGTESGMDNSPRFDNYDPDRPLLAVDFSVFIAREAQLLADMWGLLDEPKKSSHWRAVASNVSAAVHATLWDAERGFYFDRHTARDGGAFSDVRAVSGLLPLWLPDIPADRVTALVSTLLDPDLFDSTVPLPSVAANSSTFSTDMWRGPMWINTNYHIVLALMEKNHTSLARSLMERTVDVVGDWYARFGVLFEFYDAANTTAPTVLSRKGHQKCGGVRDYHWTAALTFKMLLALEDAKNEKDHAARGY